jgi:succinylglutamate desuccinylase
MATLTIVPTTHLTIRDALPDGLLRCGARDLHLILDGPTLIELPGKAEPPLFVSILLHGNEDSGLGAVQRVLRSYLDEPLPRSLMLLIGNVQAARQGLRRLDGQPDYNRIWPGTPNDGQTFEARIMAEVYARAVDRCVFGAIDVHNNTGRNPHYSVVCDLDPRTLGLAVLFARRAVRFRGIPGTSTASFAGLIPAVTIECGLPGHAANEDAAAQFLNALLNLDELPAGPSDRSALDLYHTLGVVRLREDVSFLFGTDEAGLRFDPAIDSHNFEDLPPGTILGATVHPMPLSMIDEGGRDVAEQYFEVSHGKLRLRKKAVPAMLTTDPRIVRQDCLCYLMERL